MILPIKKSICSDHLISFLFNLTLIQISCVAQISLGSKWVSLNLKSYHVDFIIWGSIYHTRRLWEHMKRALSMFNLWVLRLTSAEVPKYHGRSSAEVRRSLFVGKLNRSLIYYPPPSRQSAIHIIFCMGISEYFALLRPKFRSIMVVLRPKFGEVYS
jgi:hypothetical protein